jgi:hypothetical protein
MKAATMSLIRLRKRARRSKNTLPIQSRNSFFPCASGATEKRKMWREIVRKDTNGKNDAWNASQGEGPVASVERNESSDDESDSSEEESEEE